MSPISYHSTYCAILHATFISIYAQLNNKVPFELCQQFNISYVCVISVQVLSLSTSLSLIQHYAPFE